MCFLRWKARKREIIRIFRSGNVSVAGHKGSGKDLLFNWVIHERERQGEIHASNIRFTDKTTIKHIAEYQLKNNTQKNFIFGDFNPETNLYTERKDYYLSDASCVLPSWQHSYLEKNYPTLPIIFSLSRHLGEFNIHTNAQDFTKVWDKIRIQSDYYIWCEKAKVIFGLFEYHKLVVYNRAETAFEHIQPYNVRRRFLIFYNKQDLERANEFNAKYGVVKRFKFWCLHPKNGYDSRAYYKLLYGRESEFLNGKKRYKESKKNEKKSNKKNNI